MHSLVEQLYMRGHWHAKGIHPVLKSANPMDEKMIKLIWDFRGPDAHGVALHHEAHLKEYIASEDMNVPLTGHKDLSDLHSVAFMVVAEGQMPQVRDALRPHRGEIYEEQSG